MLCSKSGARWAYFHPSDVSVVGATTGYRREDKEDPAAEVHFCAHCGSTTHFVLTASAVAKFGNSQVGVNVRLEEFLAAPPSEGALPSDPFGGRAGDAQRGEVVLRSRDGRIIHA